MYLFYTIALSLLLLALLPYFIYQAIRYGKYASNFKERLGLLPRSFNSDPRPAVWVHTVSVGEFNAARPLIALLGRELPGYRIVVSTTTITGQKLARSANPALDGVLYFPLDWPSAVRRALRRVKPEIVIILETELWPNFLRECRRLGVVAVIANGRISERSFSRYMRVRTFISQVLQDISLLVMQSEADAERACALGAHPDRVKVCGNLKYDVSDSATPDLRSPAPDSSEVLDRYFALSSSPNLIIAGSTAPGEESILLEALSEIRLRAGLSDARLVIAPRHPERFDEVASLIARSGFKFARRSQLIRLAAPRALGRVDSSGSYLDSECEPGEADELRAADVILLDSIGELAALYRFAAVVFVGGSLVAYGGHNVIEPAVYAKPIIVGPHTENFRQIVADFLSEDALVEVSEPRGFAREVIELLSDREQSAAMGARALAILRKSQGATKCTVEAIARLLVDNE